MASHQGTGGVQPHLPSLQSSYPDTQGLVMGSNPTMVPVSVTEERGREQGGTETSGGMNPGGTQQPQSPRDFNMVLLCQIGQETVQEIVEKTTELFQTLKGLHPPDGTTANLTEQEEKKAEMQENLKTIATHFKKLRRIYEKCNENCSTKEYTDIKVDSLVPLKDEIDSHQEDKPTGSVKYLTEEHRELVEKLCDFPAKKVKR